MLAVLIQEKMKYYSISQIMQVIDGCVVAVGLYVFGARRALYAVIAVYLVARISDGLIEGLKFSKAAYIVTEKQTEVANLVMEELRRGLTGVFVKGMYSGENKLMLFCIVNKKEIVYLRERVHEMDPTAFVIVSDVREVHGEGFIESV